MGIFFLFSSDREYLKSHRNLGCRQDSGSLFGTGRAFLLNFGDESFIDLKFAPRSFGLKLGRCSNCFDFLEPPASF